VRRLGALIVGTVLFVTIVIPVLVVRWDKSAQPARGVPPPKPVRAGGGEMLQIRVFLPNQGKVLALGLEEYVKGVVAAEMPAEFELEALKAQAVAARTYAVRNMRQFGGPGAPDRADADVTADYRQQGQAWLDEAALRSKWGAAFERYWEKIGQAVDETRGLIATYGGEPINAVFHSSSGDRTASAKEVWGFDCPYLKSVPSPWDRLAPRYSEIKEIPFSEAERRLGPEAGVVAAAKIGNGEVAKVLARTDSGRVERARVGSKVFSGAEIRDKLELRSANFVFEPTPASRDVLIVRTIGYGHGVGLSQYGANGMAKEGRDFRQILSYYYTGVSLKNIYGE